MKTILFQEAKTVAGGGAAEMLMSTAVAAEAPKTPGKESIAIEAFARALAKLPTIISDNAGFDSAELVAQLRAAHANGKHNMGISELLLALHWFSLNWLPEAVTVTQLEMAIILESRYPTDSAKSRNFLADAFFGNHYVH